MYNFLPDLIFSFLFKNNILASRIYSLNCIDTFYINLWFLISLENLVKLISIPIHTHCKKSKPVFLYF